jgi:hypothetical protein
MNTEQGFTLHPGAAQDITVAAAMQVDPAVSRAGNFSLRFCRFLRLLTPLELMATGFRFYRLAERATTYFRGGPLILWADSRMTGESSTRWERAPLQSAFPPPRSALD